MEYVIAMPYIIQLKKDLINKSQKREAGSGNKGSNFYIKMVAIRWLSDVFGFGLAAWLFHTRESLQFQGPQEVCNLNGAHPRFRLTFIPLAQIWKVAMHFLHGLNVSKLWNRLLRYNYSHVVITVIGGFIAVFFSWRKWKRTRPNIIAVWWWQDSRVLNGKPLECWYSV